MPVHDLSRNGTAGRDTSLSVVLFSGGLDSTTVLTYALRRGLNPRAISFRYGQTHARELLHAERIADALEVPYLSLDIRALAVPMFSSALTGAIEIPENRTASDRTNVAKRAPDTYVSMRNTLFLTIGAQLLESMVTDIVRQGIHPSRIEASLLYGAAKGSVYPDCQPPYIDLMQKVLTRGGNWPPGVKFMVGAPLINETKKEIIEMATFLQAPVEMTWTCYSPQRQIVGDEHKSGIIEVPCEVCDACLGRADAFTRAGVPDPARGFVFG